MLAPADRTVRATHEAANRQIDRLLLLIALHSGTWYAHRRARRTMPRIVRGAAVTSVLVAVGAGIVIARHRLGVDDRGGHAHPNGAAVAPPAP